jgi:pilus assembly protein CpaF
MLQALNTGHDGSMSTIHANGTADALTRLETLVLMADSGLPLAAVRAQMASCIDAVVFVARRPYGVRRVESIAQVDGRLAGGVRALFERRDEGLVPVARPTRPSRRPEVSVATGRGGVAVPC